MRMERLPKDNEGLLHKESHAEQRFEKENKGLLTFDAEAYDDEIAPKATWQKGLRVVSLLFSR